jgi:hypothetical protein
MARRAASGRMQMKNLLLLLLLTCCVSQASCKQQVFAATAQATANEAVGTFDAPEIVDRIMRAEYGPLDASACHRYVDDSTGLQYCMRVDLDDIHVVGERSLFFMAHSDPTTGDYASVDPGVMATYEVLLKDGREEIVAKNKAMTIGAAGSCQCEQAQFLEMGPHSRFGWLFTYGGTWQGTASYTYAIIAPVGSEFRNISEIPQIEEDQQQVTYSISVTPSLQSEGLYPLDISKSLDGKRVQRMKVEYDPIRRTYHF